MNAIEMRFLAGRFHATPWGRNVNEGEVEWPPSPFRLARALLDVWYRRFPELPRERVEAVLRLLAGAPGFALPPATAAHTRFFMSANKPNPSDRQKIFDAFVALDKKAPVMMALPGEAPDEALSDLEDLLDGLAYLGRSESWLDAGLVRDAQALDINCQPVEQDKSAGEEVTVACLVREGDYDQLAKRPQAKQVVKGRLKPTGKAAPWLDALGLSTADLLSEGWSDHPAIEWRRYVRPIDALRPRIKPAAFPSPAVRSVTYSLAATVKPKVEATVIFAERVRTILMGIHRKVMGDDPSKASPVFSGKDRRGKPLTGHRHAFFLPMDTNGDGRLDTLRIQAKEAFSSDELEALDRLTRVWQSGRLQDVRLVLTSTERGSDGPGCRQFVSATPFVTARHYRKGRGDYPAWLSAEVERECGFHGLPAPLQVEWIDGTLDGAHKTRWWQFVRNRKGGQPLAGHGCILTFDESVPGPFALGSGCHFGLGLFVPVKD